MGFLQLTGSQHHHLYWGKLYAMLCHQPKREQYHCFFNYIVYLYGRTSWKVSQFINMYLTNGKSKGEGENKISLKDLKSGRCAISSLHFFKEFSFFSFFYRRANNKGWSHICGLREIKGRNSKNFEFFFFHCGKIPWLLQ